MKDLSPLAGLSTLQELSLSRTDVTDLSPLAGLRNLEWLHLVGTSVTKEGVVALQKALSTCRVFV